MPILATQTPNKVTPSLKLPTMVGANGDISSAMMLLDAILHGGPKSASTVTPPVGPNQGDMYIVPTGATGVWSGQAGNLAICNPAIVKDGVPCPYQNEWDFVMPKVGMQFYVQDIGAEMTYQSSGTWQQATVSFLTTPPTTATSSGVRGQMAADASYLYFCYGTNLWHRVSCSTF
jgi:hypothetical protein